MVIEAIEDSTDSKSELSVSPDIAAERSREARIIAWCAAALIVLSVVLRQTTSGTTLRDVDVADALLLSATFTLVGGAIASRLPHNAFGWVALAIGATGAAAGAAGSAPEPELVAWLGYWLFWVAYALIPVALLLFPTGRLTSPRWRFALVLASAGLVVGALGLAVARGLDPDPLGLNGPSATGAAHFWLVLTRFGVLLSAVALIAAIVSLVVRLRRADDVEFRQLLCLGIGGVAMFFALGLASLNVPGAWVVGVVAVPASAGVAILWHHLYDLDLLINRTLVYLGLSVSLLTGYVAIVWLGNELVGGDEMPSAVALAAAAVIALGLNPVRDRFQRSVDALLYGRRNDPYAVMSAVSRRFESPSEPEAMLSSVVEALARNLALPYAAIELASDSDLRCEWGRKVGAPIVLPLNYAGRHIGSLVVAARTIGGTLTKGERKLLEDLSFQVALTAHAVELSRGLQRSREQLVGAREEERRRLRGEVHDRVGPGIAAIVMKLEAARNLLRTDPETADKLLDVLSHDAQGAVADVRRLAHGLRPPALDELGLLGAIRDCTERFAGGEGLDVRLQAPDKLPPLPAATEVAALMIVQEAVANVAAHSGARNCAVRLHVDGALRIDIDDDGRGLAPGYRPGVGLSSMEERAVEIGGACAIESAPSNGTQVHVRLPLPAK